MIVQTIIDFLHLLATVAWMGGAIYTNLVLMPSLNAIEPPARGKLMGAVSKRFTILAWSSIVVLLVTGYMKTPTGMLFNTTEAYGMTLTVKHILFLSMVALASLIMLVVVPKMNALAPKSGEKPSNEFIRAQKLLPRLSVTATVLGIVVLLCVALLKV
jgi:uncharacterized membrane protein